MSKNANHYILSAGKTRPATLTEIDAQEVTSFLPYRTGRKCRAHFSIIDGTDKLGRPAQKLLIKTQEPGQSTWSQGRLSRYYKSLKLAQANDGKIWAIAQEETWN